MLQDRETGMLKPFRFDNILIEVPELKKFNFNLSTYTFDPPLDSSNITPQIWIRLVEIIERNYEKFDGFIILHGTDTMSYSASALSFMLENLGKPVIFTGSQLPIGSIRTDGKENLISSIEIAAAVKNGKPVVPEVCIFFENKLFRGNRTTKNNTEDFHAFLSGNHTALAESGVHIRYNFDAIMHPDSSKPFRIKKELNNNVVILKIFPGISRQIVEQILNINGLRAVIMETFGSGNAPEQKWFIDCIKNALLKDIVVLNVTQCSIGNVDMGIYETSRKLAEAGVVSGHDITTEAAMAKLMHLTGISTEKEWIVEQLGYSLRGEITI